LASLEEKFSIAEAYGNEKVEEFLSTHTQFLEDVEEIDSSEEYEEEISTEIQILNKKPEDEEYFSTSSTEIEPNQNEDSENEARVESEEPESVID